MKAWMVVALVGGSLASVVPPDEVVRVEYGAPVTKDLVEVDIHVDHAERTLHYHVKEQHNIGDVECMEDYNTGWGANRVADDEACYIHKLNMTLEQATQRVHQMAREGRHQIEGNLDILAIPDEDVEEWAGERLRDFCGEYPMYKLVRTEDEDPNAVDEPQERQSSFTFTKCFFYFFFYKCITVIITIPTGVTLIIFPFLFG